MKRYILPVDGSIHSLILFKNGKEIQRFAGLQSEKVLSDTVKRMIKRE
jgi:thioredoxin-like negative regulator of GroEL